tara:strand:- start:2353 stop:3507 length:1155 start_codon:yes stop_codon:yes gene_type:complete
MKQKRILFNISEDWFFLSHFLSRALNAKKSGFEIYVCCNETNKRKIIESHGIKFIKHPYRRSNINPIYEIYILIRLLFVIKKTKPDLIHNIALKPIIHGSFAARLLNFRTVINAPVGMGYVFSSNNLKAKLLKPIVLFLLRIFLDSNNGKNKRGKVIFENNDDLKYFKLLKAVDSRHTCVISGAGVEIDKAFSKKKRNNKIPKVILIARMLKDKGVYEFYEAFQLLKNKKIKCQFVLVGDVDPLNPASLKRSTLKKWKDENLIQWLGWIDDIKKVLLETDILCLPSYREGLPKSLVEGAAAGIPLIATDTVGCREVVIDGYNGFLVPIKDSEKLAAAIEKLIMDSSLRKLMGRESFKMASEKFSSTKINSLTLKVYNELCLKVS